MHHKSVKRPYWMYYMDFMDFLFVLLMIILAFEVSDVDNFFSSTFAFAGLIEIGHVSRRFDRDQIIEIHLLVLRVRQLFMAKFPRRFSTAL